MNEGHIPICDALCFIKIGSIKLEKCAISYLKSTKKECARSPKGHVVIQPTPVLVKFTHTFCGMN